MNILFFPTFILKVFPIFSHAPASFLRYSKLYFDMKNEINRPYAIYTFQKWINPFLPTHNVLIKTKKNGVVAHYAGQPWLPGEAGGGPGRADRGVPEPSPLMVPPGQAYWRHYQVTKDGDLKQNISINWYDYLNVWWYAWWIYVGTCTHLWLCKMAGKYCHWKCSHFSAFLLNNDSKYDLIWTWLSNCFSLKMSLV